MDTAVEVADVRKTYGDTVALSGVSLSMDRGEVFGLIGPNGAGKTTLVRALTGTTVPDAGTIRVLGSPPTETDRDRLGVLPQAFSPPDRLTARELLGYYAGLYETSREPDQVLSDVGLADAGETWYENLSGGQRRRVCVGAVLVNDPDLLFLDEPTTGIDPAGRRTVWRLLEELAAGGTTILLTTHDMAEAERLADRVGLLSDGSLAAVGTPAALVDEYGGDRRLTVETDADPGSLDGLDYPVTARNGRVVVRGVAPADIGSVVDVLESAGVDYSGLSWAEPTLEDVYLAVAGEVETGSLRADDRSGVTLEPSDAREPAQAGGDR